MIYFAISCSIPAQSSYVRIQLLLLLISKYNIIFLYIYVQIYAILDGGKCKTFRFYLFFDFVSTEISPFPFTQHNILFD